MPEMKHWAHKVFERIRYSGATIRRQNHPLFGEGTNYQKFILLSAQRSGSNLVMSTLRTHPEIASFGELFVRTRVDFEIDGFDVYSEKMRYLRNRHPIDFLNRYIFSGYRDDIRAVGFKLFPETVREMPLKPVWEWLGQSKDIKLIVTFRRNHLASYASLVKAKQSGVWIVGKGERASQQQVALEYDACRFYFEGRQRTEDQVRELIKGRDVFELPYEQLVGDPQRGFRDMQAWLGVAPRKLEIPIQKQETRPLSELILNFDDLRKRFRGSQWAGMFDEGPV